MNFKKTLLLTVFVISLNATSVIAQDFITTWQTTTTNESITIPTTGGGYSYTVDWGDGTGDATVYTGNASHVYATAGVYTVSISGSFPSIYFDNTGDKAKILSVEQWGGQVWTSMVGAFSGCSNLVINATDDPNLSSVTNMARMFLGTASFNQDISTWDVSGVTSMTQMFLNATAFNQDISSWNVSNVTNMNTMFCGATAFDQDLSTWDVSNVTWMSAMFSGATSFNQDLSTWDVSNVTDMSNMFNSATAFNQDLSTWDVSSVTKMNGMFSMAWAFNQDVSGWNVSNVTDMSYMFNNDRAFNQDISGWDVSKVTNMREMFRSSAIKQDLSSWDVSNVTDMSGMFCFVRDFNYDITSWNVSNVTTMAEMFESASSFNQDLSAWDKSKVTNMSYMFTSAEAFNQDLSSWDISHVTNMTGMLNRTAISITNYDLLLEGWAAQNVQPGVTLGAQYLKYCDGYDAREVLISKGWSFVGDEPGCTQYITFDPLDPKTFGDAPFALIANASSGLPVGFWSSDETIATISGNILTIEGAGSVQIWAYQNGGSGYMAATPVQQVLTVNKAYQSITFDPLTAKTIGDAPYTLMAHASSGLNLTYSSSDVSVATIDGNTVTLVGVGSTTITASQNGNGNYYAASPVDQVLEVNMGTQSITFGPLDAKTFGDAPFDLTATASSGLAITYSSSDETVATIEGSTITILGAGSTTITASQTGNINYYPASSVDQTLIVNKADQSIAFDPLATDTYGDAPFVLTAIASSGLEVSYSSSDESIATIDGDVLTIVGVGSATITASQSGNDNYYAATDIDQVLNINRADQIITFDSLSPITYGDSPFTLSASASSGLEISYSSSDGTVALVGGNTVTIVGVGSTIITASQAGDDNYYAATPVLQVLTVNKANQTITFSPLDPKTIIDDPFDLSATASSGLDVTYSSSDETVATIDGNTVTILALGTTTITARQAGNDNYNPADSINQILTVNKADQTITFNPLPAKMMGDGPFELTAVASSELDISYSSSDGTVATVDGNTVTIHGVGTTTITASQDGDDSYFPATPVDQSLVINSPEALSIKQANISFYPNPASDYIMVQTTSSVERLEIIDMNGRLMGTQEHNYVIDTGNLSNGIYLLKVFTEDNVYIGRFIKQ